MHDVAVNRSGTKVEPPTFDHAALKLDLEQPTTRQEAPEPSLGSEHRPPSIAATLEPSDHCPVVMDLEF